MVLHWDNFIGFSVAFKLILERVLVEDCHYTLNTYLFENINIYIKKIIPSNDIIL